METTSKTSTNVALKWAVIYLVTIIIITYAFQFLNVDQGSPIKYITFIPFIAFLCLAQKEFKDQLGGFMTYGQGFVAGLLYAVFAGLMLAVFYYIYFGILSPQVMEQMMNAQQDKLTQQGLSSEQMDKAMEISKKYGAIITAISTAFITPIMGAIISLIGAAIFKKEPTLADIEQTNTPTE